MNVQEVRCRSILNRSKLMDFCLNPYLGCEHNCVYCYNSVFIQRWYHPSEEWGTFVDVKVNAPEVLAKQLRNIKKGTIYMSSVCDAYQPVESKFKITRRCLERLRGYQDRIRIQTRSDLVLRDLDVLRQIPNVEVGMTITTLEPEIASLFEPKASLPEDRLEALRMLKGHGIPTHAFVGPILPHFSDKTEVLEKIFRQLREVGVGEVLVDRLSYLNRKVGTKVRRLLKEHHPELLPYYKYAATDEYGDDLRARVAASLAKIDLKHRIVF